MQLADTPARARLEWVLAALAGAELTAEQVEDVLAAEFLERVAAEAYVARMRARSSEHAPCIVLGVEIGEFTARAKVRTRTGRVVVVGCVVAPGPPHHIRNTWVIDEIPGFLGPRLPATFTRPARPTTDARLVLVSGVPGTGKSTLADAIGRELPAPCFAGDWLLGALTPFGGYHLSELFGIAEELLTTLALRQLELGQSAILDFPAENGATRERWRSLAVAYGARLRVIVCVCSDPARHRHRAEQRRRAIPGWHDAADWTDIQQRQERFPAWGDEALVVDAVNPVERNLRVALDHILL
jgi:predicted kinase